MTKKARFGEDDVEYVRHANPSDPGFDPKVKVPQALIRDSDGKKYVVPANELLMYAANDEATEAVEDAAPTTIKQNPPEKKSKVERRK